MSFGGICRATCEATLVQRQDELERLVSHRESFVQELDSMMQKLGSEVETMVR